MWRCSADRKSSTRHEAATACANTIGTVRLAPCKAAIVGLAVAKITSGVSATNSVANLRSRSALPPAQRIYDPHIFAFGPAKFLQALPEGRNASLSYRIIRCSRASFNSRASCAALVSLLAARELRPRAAFGASRRFNVFGRCVFAALPPVLSRRLIASPET